MIKAYEIHIQTTKTISDMLDYFKTQNVNATFEMCTNKKEWCKFKIKNPNKNIINDYLIRIYSEMDGVYEYEIMTWDEESHTNSIKWFDFK